MLRTLATLLFNRISGILPLLSLPLMFAHLGWCTDPYRFSWAAAGGGTGTDGASDIDVQPDGRQYVVGSFQNAATFVGTDWVTVTHTAAGNADGFLARYATNGGLQWVRTVGGTGYDAYSCVAALPGGGCAALASIQGTARFDAGTPQEATLTVPARGLALVLYDSDGTRTGITHAESTDVITGVRLKRGENGRLWATGSFRGSAVFGVGEALETQVVKPGTAVTTFVACYEAGGPLVWVKTIDNSPGGTDLLPLSDGTVWAAGAAVAPTTFGAGEPNQVVWESIPPYSNEGRYLCHYAADGTLIAHKRIPGAFAVAGLGYAGRQIRIAEGDNGSLLLAGSFASRLVLALGESNETVINLGSGLQNTADIFLAKLASNGTLLWSRRVGGVYGDAVWSLASFADGSPLLTGTVAGTVVFGQGEPDETTISTYGQANDIFLALYRPDGSLSEVVIFGGSSMTEQATGIVVAPDESIRVAGSFTTQIIFNRNMPDHPTLNSAGGVDVFVARFDRLAAPGSVSPQWSTLPLVGLPADSGTHTALLNLANYATDASTPPDGLRFYVERQSNPEMAEVSTTLEGIVSVEVKPGKSGLSIVVVRVSNPYGCVADASLRVVVGSTGVPEFRWEVLK